MLWIAADGSTDGRAALGAAEAPGDAPGDTRCVRMSPSENFMYFGPSRPVLTYASPPT